MKRLKIFKAYFVLWLFVYFIAISNIETFKLYFLSTLTFNIAIVSLLAIGTFMLLKAAKELTMVAGTFGVIMYKKGDISFYLKGIEKVFPTTIADKIYSRAAQGVLLFTQQEADDILAWLEEKYSNQNKYNNFFIGTVLMIGLLGTFAGLLGSIASMGGIVSSLAGDNVDIGKIMGDFAVPLSAMAVGFGSSLFGVISAILLSIKGYLLNKAQESLLTGVENWLQSRRVDSLEEESEGVALAAPQKSYMDIFVEQIALLSSQMREVGNHNREIQRQLTDTIHTLGEASKEERVLLAQMHHALEKIASRSDEAMQLEHQSYEKLGEISQSNQTLLTHLSSLQSYHDKSQEETKRREHIITNMVLKQERKEDESKMALFEIADSIDSMNKNIRQRLSHLEKLAEKKSHHDSIQSKVEDSFDFMKKHFSKEENH